MTHSVSVCPETPPDRPSQRGLSTQFGSNAGNTAGDGVQAAEFDPLGLKRARHTEIGFQSAVSQNPSLNQQSCWSYKDGAGRLTQAAAEA